MSIKQFENPQLVFAGRTNKSMLMSIESKEKRVGSEIFSKMHIDFKAPQKEVLIWA